MKTAILVDLDFFIRKYKTFNKTFSTLSSEEQAKTLAKVLLEHCNKHLAYKK